MIDQLISFETAKLAKDKGFMMAVHMGNVELPNWFYTIEANGYPDGTLNHVHVGIPAPTQSLLQKWLREVHNIHIYVNYYQFVCTTEDGYYYHIGLSVRSWRTNITGKYSTYELALEQGLIEALKLIP